MAQENEATRRKEVFDKIRREVKEQQDANDKRKQIPLEDRRGITVFPLKTERGEQ
jgi:hypothetical protein